MNDSESVEIVVPEVVESAVKPAPKKKKTPPKPPPKKVKAAKKKVAKKVAKTSARGPAKNPRAIRGGKLTQWAIDNRGLALKSIKPYGIYTVEDIKKLLAKVKK